MGKTKRINFPPPSSSQKKIRNDIVQCFGQFWNNSKISVAEKNRGELDSCISECAEIVALIKEYLEAHQRGPVRINQGNGREVLWNFEEFPKDKKEFVSSLVHALFFDGTQYTSKLTKEELNHLIHEADEHLIKRNTNNLDVIKNLESEIKQTWEESNKLIEEIFKKIDENPLASPTYSNHLHKVSNSVNSIHQLLKKFHRVTSEIKEKPEDSPYSSDAEVPPVPKNSENVSKENSQELTPEQQKGSLVVKQVADDVVSISEQIKSLSENLSVIRKEEIVEDPQSAMKMIDSLHKRCIGYSESLMKDLFKLDELSLSQEDRPKRKEQVLKIQQLTTDIDSITQKIHNLIQEIKAEDEKRREEEAIKEQERKELELKKQMEEKEKKELENKKLQEEREKQREEYLSQLALKRKTREEELEKERVLRELELQKQRASFEKQLDEQATRLSPYFRRLKLQVQVEVEQAPNAYILSCHVPGMKTEDIEVSFSKQGAVNVINLKGFRGPTFEEMAIMRRQLARMGLEDDDESLLRICFGRFGTFSERYSLPVDADIQSISADYKSGELVVVIPRIKRTIPLARPSLYDNPEFFW